jgi:NAD(P)-dependent dehydrogenase (short-subunit alcohol dehydrogenase family)
VDINPDAARRTLELIRNERGEALDLVADVTSSEQVNATVQGAVAAFGRLDILHNNVGLNSHGGPVEMDESVWDRIIATNMKSLFLACKAAIPAMIGNGGGSIINVSSLAGVTWIGRPSIAYGTSKAAVNHFTRSIAAQYGPEKIRCNTILPGTIDTPRASSQLHKVWKGDVEEMRRQRSKAVPLRRLGTPWDVANAAVFLASDESSYVSGSIIAVDGGAACVGPHLAPDNSAS